MTKTEFLEKLQAALEQNVDPGTLRENMEYYSQYITDEMRKGKSQEEVTAALGDPWAIARTIIDTSGNGPGSGNEYVYDAPGQDSYSRRDTYGSRDSYRRQETSRGSVHVFGFDTWWKKLLLALAVAGVFLLIIAVVSGIIRLVAPLILPVLLIVLVIRLIGGRR